MSGLSESQQSNKRQRLERSSSLKITDLPDVLLKECLSFVGPGHYRFVAGTCKRFGKQHSFPKETTWENAAVSIPRAKFCLDDHDAKAFAVEMIASGAASIGQVKVIEWAHEDHSYLLDEDDFARAGKNGHLDVLKWGESKGLEWCSEKLSVRAAAKGHLALLEWIYQQTGSKAGFAFGAACGGQIHVLQWLKDNELFRPGSASASLGAAMKGQIPVLKWLQQNGLLQIHLLVDMAARGGHIDVLLWCREQAGCEFTALTCLSAAKEGHLDTLKWLRQNGAPWDGYTISKAEESGHHHVAEWARANGCPEPNNVE